MIFKIIINYLLRAPPQPQFLVPIHVYFLKILCFIMLGMLFHVCIVVFFKPKMHCLIEHLDIEYVLPLYTKTSRLNTVFILRCWVLNCIRIENGHRANKGNGVYKRYGRMGARSIV